MDFIEEWTGMPFNLAGFLTLISGIMMLYLSRQFMADLEIEKPEEIVVEVEKIDARVIDPEAESDSSSESETDSEDESTIHEESSAEPDADLKIGKLHGKLATAQLTAETRKWKEAMSQEEIEYENRVNAEQMEDIVKLMMKNKDKFGMSREDIQEQMNLYKF